MFLALGTACEDCRALDGKTFKLKKMMPGDNAPPMHSNCRCSVAAAMSDEEFKELTGVDPADIDLDAINAAVVENYKAERKTQGEKGSTSYEGIPKTWKDLKNESERNDISKVNPSHYKDYCVNCVIAYEMRQRGKAVVAAPIIKKLRHYPERAWVNPDIHSIEAGEDAYYAIRRYIDGINNKHICVQINVVWNNRNNLSDFWTNSNKIGHSFVCKVENGEPVFIDVQSGSRYNKNIFSRCNNSKITFWRIDNLETTDLGATACIKEEGWYDFNNGSL